MENIDTGAAAIMGVSYILLGVVAVVFLIVAYMIFPKIFPRDSEGRRRSKAKWPATHPKPQVQFFE